MGAGPALRLASVSMTLTVGAIAAAGVYGMRLSWGSAILLGAILAPTDAVLASDVQVEHPFDYDPLRFALTGEVGINDGTAFPFVMIGLGLLGLHELEPFGMRWFFWMFSGPSLEVWPSSLSWYSGRPGRPVSAACSSRGDRGLTISSRWDSLESPTGRH
jgi:hypothetical protein